MTAHRSGARHFRSVSDAWFGGPCRGYGQALSDDHGACRGRPGRRGVFASSVFVPVSSMPSWLQPLAKVSPVTLTANAARSLALVPGTPSSLGGAIAWIAGLLTVFIPLSVWRYRRMT